MTDIDIPYLRPDAMDVDDAITAFATTTDTLPLVPLVWCLANWNLAGPPLLSLLQRYADGSDRSERTTDAALFCIYLTAAAREKQAFALLCLLARDEEAMELALGDGVTESFQNILISTFDGNLDLLKGVIEDGAIDDFIRSSGLQALAYLAAAGEIDRTETEAYLAALSDSLNAVPGEFVWSAWAEAIAMLGLEKLKPLIRTAYDDGRIPTEISDFDWYEDMMRTASENDDPLSVFQDNDIRVITDIGAEFDGWYSFSEERRRDDREREAGFSYPDFSQPVTAHNPYRAVGRNDPCPCGSGKKFKKCCLN